eukprot:tig00021070_g17868.t1
MARERAAKRARAGDAPDPRPAAGGDTISAGASLQLSSAGPASSSAAALSRVAAAMAAGGSPFDALPDELVTRIIGEASEWSYIEIGSITDYSGSRRCTDQDLCELVRLSHVSRRFRSLAQQPSLWRRIAGKHCALFSCRQKEPDLES